MKTIKDNVPRISFEGRPPQGIATVKKTANIAWQAKDDYGLGNVYLVYTLSTPGENETPQAQRIQINDPQGRISAGDSYVWNPAKSIPDLKPGVEINYYLETTDLKPQSDKEDERVARSPVKQLAIVSNEDYVAWFRRELDTRNDAVRGVFKNELEASKKIKELLPQPKEKP